MSPSVREAEASSWSNLDLADVLAALCQQCADLAGVHASIVVRDEAGEFFPAASSVEWACTLDDFQLSEETGPAWECCTTGQATSSTGRQHRGVTGTHLADQASPHGITGCRSVPLSGQGGCLGALTLYWGPSIREDSLLTTGIAVAAIAVKAIEYRRTADVTRETLDAPAQVATTFGERESIAEVRLARATARDAQADLRDARAAQRDARASERDARASAREKKARARDAATGLADPRTTLEQLQVQARRDRYAAARDRLQARSDRAAARLDRVVSATERVESSIDGLTGAYRRDAGMLELEHEVTRAQRTGDAFVLAFVDVDNLKARNDLHGHIAGDQLLRRIADTIRANVRSYDLVVRYGGDEFVCGFPALDVKDAAERFARINGDLAANDEASVAFGLAELQRGETLTDLITRADGVMYANRHQRLSRTNVSLDDVFLNFD
jgi:diguanylate cyclase (GGDEF)-like protein